MELTAKTFAEIAQKSGRMPTACSCEYCKIQCRTPCLGTPEDITILIEAGYKDRLAPTMWAAGILMGVTARVIRMIQPKQEADGWCTFRTSDGLCELHDKGLKPTEGRLSHHTLREDNFDPSKSLSWLVAQQWIPLQPMFEK